MRTWAGAHSAPSLRRIRHSTDLVISDLTDTRTPKALRDRLTELLIAASAGDFAKHRDELETTLRTIIGASRPDLALANVESYLAAVEARLAGLAPFTNGTDQSVFPDKVLRRSGAICRQSSADYLAASPTAHETNQHLFNNACLTLVMLLGHSALATPHASETR